MPTRLIATLLLLVGAGTLVSTSIASAAPPSPASTVGSVGIRLVALPGTSPSDPLGSSYIVDRLPPGASLSRSVEIDNHTHSTADVSVYPASASIVRGDLTFAAGHAGNELSSWTSVGDHLLRLAPGSEVFDTLTIRVPMTASPGERYAVLWAEVSAHPATGGVTLVNRVGIRIYLSVGPGGGPQSSFTIGPLTTGRSTSGEPLVRADVRNSGQNTIEIGGNLVLSDGPDGLRAGPFATPHGMIISPSASRPIIVQLDSGLPRGPWRADLSLTTGLLQHSAAATITFPPSGAAKPPPAEGYSTLVLVVIVLFVLLAITALGLLVSRRRIWRMQAQ
jgi:hypothetical protein